MYVEVPRKNGKSTLGAGIALYLLFSDGEPGAEIYSAAADREQAAIIFDVARQMVEQDSDLRSRCEVFRRSIVVAACLARRGDRVAEWAVGGRQMSRKSLSAAVTFSTRASGSIPNSL